MYDKFESVTDVYRKSFENKFLYPDDTRTLE